MRFINLFTIVSGVYAASLVGEHSAFIPEVYLYNRHLGQRPQNAMYIRGVTHFRQSGCSFAIEGLGNPDIDDQREFTLNGGSHDVFPLAMCPHEGAILTLPREPCEGCSAILHEEWDVNEGVSLECAIPQLEGIRRVTYGGSDWSTGFYESLVRADPRFIALGVSLGDDVREAWFSEPDGRFTTTRALRIMGGPPGMMSIQAPAGSDAHHMCGFIGRYIAPRLIAFAKPQIDAAAAGGAVASAPHT